MSFSSEVKAELSGNVPGNRHCQIAELAAMISMVARIGYWGQKPATIVIVTERSVIAREIAFLIKKLFGYVPECKVVRTGVNSRSYKMEINSPKKVEKILQTLKIENMDCVADRAAGQRMTGGTTKADSQGAPGRADTYGSQEITVNATISDRDNMKNVTDRVSCQRMKVSRLVVTMDCCRRAYIRGVFMTSGSVSDPNKSYHLEIVCDNFGRAEFIREIIGGFSVESKIIQRKKYHVVYIKDGEMIVDMLNIMGAYKSLMDMENIRIRKDIRNNINRRVNCEAANLNKTVSAAVKQVNDINYIIETKGIDYLPENLQELALARLSNEDSSLKELGEMMTPPIGKSGVNHRLRRISEIAEDLRGGMLAEGGKR
jgi:hypothetical protein